jgi:aldose 1-epimerase
VQSHHPADHQQLSYVTYSVQSNPPRFTTRIVSIPLDQATPAMLSTHIYWNIGSFSQPTILNDTLQLPNADRIIPIDGISIPTGELKSVRLPWANPPVALNFTEPRTIGDANGEECGTGCVGIDNAFIIDRSPYAGLESTDAPVLKWHSPDTGISMSLRTNQGSLQIYNCVGQAGAIATKKSQQQDGVTTVNKYGCLVIEPQQWIDGINNPQWGQTDRQIFGPDTRVAENWAQYEFGTY